MIGVRLPSSEVCAGRGFWRGGREIYTWKVIRQNFYPYAVNLPHQQDKMDINKLVEVLRATLQPDQREQAERQLNEVRVSEGPHVKKFQDGGELNLLPPFYDGISL